MTPWQASQTPKETLSTKYLKRIMTPTEYNKMINQYMKEKQKSLKNVRKESATAPEK